MLTLTGVTLKRLLSEAQIYFSGYEPQNSSHCQQLAFRLTAPFIFFFQYKTFCTASLPKHIRSCTADHNKWVQGKKKSFRFHLNKKKKFPCSWTIFFVTLPGYDHLAPPPAPTATAVPVWQDRTIASSKLRMLEYSAFMEVQRDPDNVSQKPTGLLLLLVLELLY